MAAFGLLVWSIQKAAEALADPNGDASRNLALAARAQRLLMLRPVARRARPGGRHLRAGPASEAVTPAVALVVAISLVPWSVSAADPCG